MPRKPKRPCSYPGYLNLMDGRFCTEYQKKRTNAPNDLGNNYLAGLFWPCIAMVFAWSTLTKVGPACIVSVLTEVPVMLFLVNIANNIIVLTI